MPNFTTNYSFEKPLVNSAIDEDRWGGQTNTNWDSVDTLFFNLYQGSATLTGTYTVIGTTTFTGPTKIQDQTFFVENTVGTEARMVCDSSRTTAGIVGDLNFRARNTVSTALIYGSVTGRAIDTTSGSEDGRLVMETRVAGAITEALRIEQGLFFPASVGGDKGAGTLNAVSLYTANLYINDEIVTAKQPTIQVFTSSGTWNKPSNCEKIKVTVVAGGGGGANGGNAGSAGGTSSFGAFCSATGGGGGFSNGNGGNGGNGVGGDINITGESGGVGIDEFPVQFRGFGGSSIFAASFGAGGSGSNQGAGGGAGGAAIEYIDVTGTSSASVTVGAGGSGGGFTGNAGIVIVEEYYR